MLVFGRKLRIARLIRAGSLVIAVAAALSLNTADALARAGAGGGFGSRGSRTFSMPPTTATAPRPASPLDRSATPFGSQTANPGLLRPSPSAGFTRSNFGRGFLGGLLGAGLFGLLFGGGLFGGLGSITGMIGFLLQLLLLFGLVRLAMAFFSNRQRMPAGGPAGGLFSTLNPLRNAASATPATRPIALAAADFSAFEDLLRAIQAAYSEENLPRLRQLTTDDMANFFAKGLATNAQNGVVNRISSVRLLQGDLSEAWREAMLEYATVAMRFSLVDAEVERRTGRVVRGSSEVITEATEVWTFCRPAGSGAEGWKLSAIQQT
jgi:predicted lipid-binding transport protein (Tim44 family)